MTIIAVMTSHFRFFFVLEWFLFAIHLWSIALCSQIEHKSMFVVLCLSFCVWRCGALHVDHNVLCAKVRCSSCMMFSFFLGCCCPFRVRRDNSYAPRYRKALSQSQSRCHAELICHFTCVHRTRFTNTDTHRHPYTINSAHSSLTANNRINQ